MWHLARGTLNFVLLYFYAPMTDSVFQQVNLAYTTIFLSYLRSLPIVASSFLTVTLKLHLCSGEYKKFFIKIQQFEMPENYSEK